MKSASPVAPLARVLALLQLASPALPVGGYAYSQGLEAAISGGRVHDSESVRRWIGDLLTLVIARFEAPVWLRIHAAALAHDDATLMHWNRELLAARETAELRAESRQMGASMLRLYPALGLMPPALEEPTYAATFAVACAQFDIGGEDGLAAYLWTWAENQVLVAVKSVPLGQQAGQSMLYALHANVQEAVEIAAGMTDDRLGSAAIGLAIASARHETQYSRLFRS
jgi:urease accessory protein